MKGGSRHKTRSAAWQKIMKYLESADYCNVEDRIEELISESKTGNVVECILFVMAAAVLWTVTLLVKDFVSLEILTIFVVLSFAGSVAAVGQVEHTLELFRIIND